MSEQASTFQVGDKVIHWAYGPGRITQIDEKELSGNSKIYYVVQIRDFTLWVPVDGDSPNSLRPPTDPEEFPTIFTILSSPGEPLSENRLERKSQLTERMKNSSLESISLLIRDLASFKKNKKMNDNDSVIFERAKNFLTREWSLSLSIPVQQAERELGILLEN
jgi:CarD family transcriptional regulator